MAKAQPVSSRSNISDPQEWLAAVLRTRFDEVLAQRTAALTPNNIEGVHDIRVAIRRLRSVIRDFAEIADKFPLNNIRKELKKLANGLGAVRDADVLIEALRELEEHESNDAVREGFGILIREQELMRQKAFERVVPQLSDDEVNSLRDRFDRSLDASIRQRGLFSAKSIADEGRQIIVSRSNDLLDLIDALYDPIAAKRLHRLRIAAKHLRYAIDLFAESDLEALAPYASEIAKLQSSLGDLHNYDVWMGKLRDMLKRRKKLDLNEPKLLAITCLLAVFARRRTKAYRTSLAHWVRLERSGFENRLRADLSGHG